MSTRPQSTPIPNADRTASTRAALVSAGADLFGERGYANVSIEEIVVKAGVTRGALYHHFKDKRELFKAVFAQTEADVIPKVAKKLSKVTDPWDAAITGSKVFLDICLEPAFQQIALIDAPAVLGVAEQQQIVDEYGGAMVSAMLTALIESGQMKPQPVEALAPMLSGALIAGATTIARASNQRRARKEVGEVVEALLTGLKT